MTLPGGEEDLPPPTLEALSGRHLPHWTIWWQPQAPPKSGVHSALETPGPELFARSCGQGDGVQQRGGALSGSPAPRDVLATQQLSLGSS